MHFWAAGRCQNADVFFLPFVHLSALYGQRAKNHQRDQANCSD